VLFLKKWILFLPLFAKNFKKIFDFVLEFADNFCCLTDDDDPQFKELFPLNEHSALPRQKSARGAVVNCCNQAFLISSYQFHQAKREFLSSSTHTASGVWTHC
jgi:hypothetical protein